MLKKKKVRFVKLTGSVEEKFLGEKLWFWLYQPLY